MQRDTPSGVCDPTHLGTTICASFSRAPLIPPSKGRRPRFSIRIGRVLVRSQAYTLARWKRFLLLDENVAKQFVAAFRDAYGDVLRLSACYRPAKPGIRRAKVLASKVTSVPGGGNENAGQLRGVL